MDIHYALRKSSGTAIQQEIVMRVADIARREHLMTVYEVGQTCSELNITINNITYMCMPYSEAEMQQFERGYKDSQ